MPGRLQFRMACLPGGSVRRKQPQLYHCQCLKRGHGEFVDVPGLFCRSANDGDAFWHHDLISDMSV